MENLINIEAERYLLGILINNPDAFFKIPSFEKEYFSCELNQQIFSKIQDLANSGNEINLATVKYYFPSDSLEILRISGEGAGLINVIAYAEIVKELAFKRKVKSILEAKLQVIENPELTTADLLESINSELSDMQANTSQYRITSFGSVLIELAQELKKERKYTPTGFDRIDYSMNGGLETGKSYALSAKPKAGKTMLKGSVANSLRKRKIPFLYIAAEMGRKEISKRIILSEIPSITVKDFYNNKKVTDYIANYKQPENMFFVDAPRITLDALRSVVTNAVKTKNIEGFILDYLQLVTGRNPKDTIAQHQENVAQTIAELCKKLGIWALYSCQINREGEVRNGDGILMAIDWLYEIVRVSEESAPTQEVYLKHVATRSGKPVDIGSNTYPSYEISANGACFYERQTN